MIEYRRETLVRICLTNSIGFSASTAVPIWLGSAGAHFEFPAWGAGAVATGQLACAALLNAATPWMFRGAHLRRLAYVAAVTALLGNGLAWLGSTLAFIAGCLLCGAGFGVLLNVSNRLIARSSAPQRGYAMVQLVEVAFCIGFYLGVPPITERFGTLSVFAVLAALSAAVFFLLAGVPVGSSVESEIHTRHDASVTGREQVVKLKGGDFPPNAAAAILSLCAAALLFAGYGSVSSSMVSIGAAAGVSVLWVGRVMALGLVAGLGGAALARVVGERAGVLLPLLAGVGVVGGDMLVVTLGGGTVTFVCSALILFLVMPFVVPYIFTLLAGLDRAGRWASIGPAFVLSGVALGPGIAGLVIRGVDFRMVGYTALACIAAAMMLFLCGQRRRVYAAAANAARTSD